MKAFQLLTTTIAHANVQALREPVSLQEIISLIGFLAVVGGGVFLAIRLRGSDKPPASLNSRHYDER